MSWSDDRKRLVEQRRRRIAEAVPGSGPVAWFDRAAWAAMAQEDPAQWSWARALGTVIAGTVLALIIAFTIYPSAPFVIGLVTAYLILLMRARTVHVRFTRAV
ncbi:MAG: hypothetical protein ACR2OC_10010 [Solirubrobacterales bacterium]